MKEFLTNYRRSTVLNGEWEFAIDPDNEGNAHYWNEPGASWPDRAKNIEVPHAWQELKEYQDYTGRAWYRRRVSIGPHENERVLIRFAAVDYKTTVWVNGERVGSNQGGYLPFEFDVTDAVTDGENVIVVEVIDPEDMSEIPHGKQGEPWYHRVSGIWQDVSLEIVPSVHVTDLKISPNTKDGTAGVVVDIIGYNEDRTIELSDITATIKVLREDSVVTSTDAVVDSDGTATATVNIENPEYWSPKNPALYDVTLELEHRGDIIDQYNDYFGFRSIESQDGQLYLNGDPFYMRGALDQGLYPKTLYRPFSNDLFEREVQLAKELGFNLIRKHIKPAHPDFLEQADRQGLLVWEEPANPTVHTNRSKREVRNQLKKLIDRDYNHPSVIIWSLYNEEWGIGNPQGLEEESSLWYDKEKQEYLAELYEETKKLDPTRLVCDNSGWAHVATDVNDYHRYFVSPDRAEAWAEDLETITSSPEDNYGATKTDPMAAPLVVSEFGTWGMSNTNAIEAFYGERPPWFDHQFLEEGLKRPAGYRERFEDSTLSTVFEDWSSFVEAWQWREYRSIKNIIEQLRAHEGVAGYVITEFSDIEWEFNGILDYLREKKVFHEDFAQINDDVLVQIDLECHAVQAGERLEADLVVSNDTTNAIDSEVQWSVFGESGTVSVELNGFGRNRIEKAISVMIPDVDDVLTEELTVSLAGGPSNEEPLTVVPQPSAEAGAVYTDYEALVSRLETIGFDVVDSFNEADIALLVDPDHTARTYVENGGTVLLLPDEDGRMIDTEFFSYRELPETESWNLVASLLYATEGVLSPYVDAVLGWEFEGLYPYDIVADATHDDDIQIGYVEGWLSNWAAAACTREHGDGRVGAFTFRVTEADDQPVGTAVLVALIKDLGNI